MPFKSKKQMKWMFANDPEMAKRWAEHTDSIADLPETVKKKKTLIDKSELPSVVKQAAPLMGFYNQKRKFPLQQKGSPIQGPLSGTFSPSQPQLGAGITSSLKPLGPKPVQNFGLSKLAEGPLDVKTPAAPKLTPAPTPPKPDLQPVSNSEYESWARGRANQGASGITPLPPNYPKVNRETEHSYWSNIDKALSYHPLNTDLPPIGDFSPKGLTAAAINTRNDAKALERQNKVTDAVTGVVAVTPSELAKRDAAYNNSDNAMERAWHGVSPWATTAYRTGTWFVPWGRLAGGAAKAMHIPAPAVAEGVSAVSNGLRSLANGTTNLGTQALAGIARYDQAKAKGGAIGATAANAAGHDASGVDFAKRLAGEAAGIGTTLPSLYNNFGLGGALGTGIWANSSIAGMANDPSMPGIDMGKTPGAAYFPSFNVTTPSTLAQMGTRLFGDARMNKALDNSRAVAADPFAPFNQAAVSKDMFGNLSHTGDVQNFKGQHRALSPEALDPQMSTAGKSISRPVEDPGYYSALGLVPQEAKPVTDDFMAQQASLKAQMKQTSEALVAARQSGDVAAESMHTQRLQGIQNAMSEQTDNSYSYRGMEIDSGTFSNIDSELSAMASLPAEQKAAAMMQLNSKYQAQTGLNVDEIQTYRKESDHIRGLHDSYKTSLKSLSTDYSNPEAQALAAQKAVEFNNMAKQYSQKMAPILTKSVNHRKNIINNHIAPAVPDMLKGMQDIRRIKGDDQPLTPEESKFVNQTIQTAQFMNRYAADTIRLELMTKGTISDPNTVNIFADPRSEKAHMELNALIKSPQSNPANEAGKQHIVEEIQQVAATVPVQQQGDVEMSGTGPRSYAQGIGHFLNNVGKGMLPSSILPPSSAAPPSQPTPAAPPQTAPAAQPSPAAAQPPPPKPAPSPEVLKAVDGIWSNLTDGEKLMMAGGLGLSAVSLISALTGDDEDGGSWLMSAIAAAAGLFAPAAHAMGYGNVLGLPNMGLSNILGGKSNTKPT